MSGRVINDWILVEIDRSEQSNVRERKTKSGIYVVENKVKEEKSKTKKCRVLQIGPKVEDCPFQVGDELLIYYQSGLASDEGYFIKEDNVYMVLDREEDKND